MRKKTFSTFEVARLLEVVPGTVANWIKAGKLPAFRTLGGHRRVTGQDLINFLKANSMPAPEALRERLNGVRKVLLVEDDPVFRKLMTRAFKSEKKWEVYSASDGFAAGELVGRVSPDVVILDIMLPDINGFKVCEIIKASDSGTIVIAVTGCDSEEIREKILASGADAWMQKPLRFQDLFAKIESLSAGSELY